MSAPEFDHFARGYDNVQDDPVKGLVGSDTAFMEAKVRWLLRDLTRRPVGGLTPRTLDYGSGIGTFQVVMRRLGFEAEMTGCELSPGMRAESKLRWGEEAPEICAMESASTAFESQQFDLVVACAVFHHICPEDRPASYQEIRRILAPGGRAYIFEHNPYNPVTRVMVARAPVDADAVLLSAAEAEQGLKEVGLRSVASSYILFFPPRLPLLGSLEQSLEWLPLGGQYVSSGSAPL